MRRVYIIGAQCTGKTTLVEATGAWLEHNQPNVTFVTIRETARITLQTHGFTRDDVRNGGERCARLQKLILQHQVEVERGCEEKDVMISDRSGIDPLVYAQMYCGIDVVQDMIETEGWIDLKSRMREATVIVCAPIQEWLVDDGTRLVPQSWEEWQNTHATVCDILKQHEVPYNVLSSSTKELDDRVKFILSRTNLIDNVV